MINKNLTSATVFCISNLNVALSSKRNNSLTKIIKSGFSIFSNGTNSVFSISQLVTSPTHQLPLNIYLYQNQQDFSVKEQNIFRLIITPHLSRKEMQLNINDFKANLMMSKIIKMHQSGKFMLAASRVIIDSAIQPCIVEQESNLKLNDPYQYIKKNMIELQKLLEIGLKIPIAYLISAKSYEKGFLDLISKKSKAISTDLVTKQGISFNEVLYDQGYNLQHIFLNSYGKNGKQFDLLQENLAFDLIEFAMILGMINFKGKIILRSDKFYERNLDYLQKVLKKAGYRLQTSMSDKKSNFMEYL